MDFQSAQSVSTESWSSNHPRGFLYFEEYLPLFVEGKLDKFPNLKNYKFRNSSEVFQSELIEYIAQLIEHADFHKKSAVFKFEQLKGHVDVLRRAFPQAIHVAIVRDPVQQRDSWFEQLALGNSYFFDTALALIKGDPDFFKEASNGQEIAHKEIFDIYHSSLLSLRPNFDTEIDLYKDSKEDFLTNLPSNYFKEIFRVAFHELEILEKQPSITDKYIRMKTRALELTQQRDEATQQRDESTKQCDELIQQRDEATQQRDELIQQRDELIQQRDEATQQRDELIQQRDELIQQRDEATQQRDELIQQRDELTQQRDEATQQRDELTQQRDELTQQRDELLNSSIWRLTKPVRDLIKLLKR
jgi:hypothetical protein